MSHISLREYRDNPYAGAGTLAAVPCGKTKGRPWYRVPVLIRANSSRACATVATGWTTVYAESATAAANWVRDHILRPETEVIAVGPKGGEVYRYIGWHSYIAGEVFGGRKPSQFDLFGG